MSKKYSYIQKQYPFDEEKKAYLIEISLDDYDDVYDEWDPAPFKKRFIQKEFDEFIVDSAEDIPLEFNLIIVLYLPEEKKDPIKEIAVDAAYRNYYSYELDKIEKDNARLKKKNIRYLFMAISFLTIGYFFQLAWNNIALEVIKEGIFIGGWVFLWEFFTNVFITRRELIGEHKAYKRIYQSPIRYIYI